MDSHETRDDTAGRQGSGRGSSGSMLATGPVERLAAECLARMGAGETVDVEAAAAQLTGEGERTQLRELLADAQSIQGLRPLRYEKRIARNRFVMLAALLILLLWGIIAILIKHR